MAKYRDAQGNISEVGNPDLNPNLIAGKTLVSDTTPLDSSITSANLQQSPTPNYQSPQQTPIYPVAGLGTPTPMEATAGENQASELNKRIQSLNTEMVGESAYKSEQEDIQGVQAKSQAVTDLETRLTSLKNEALAIPLQSQQDALGRGITTAGLKPIETANLRNNAIQALSVNSLLEASRGNLTMALDMADRAVAQKYDPIREEINANLANLELIMNDPSYTREQQNRAAQQKAIQEERAATLEAQVENDKAKGDAVIKLLSNNPQLDSLSVQALQAAKTPLEVAQIANYLGLQTAPAGAQPTSVEEFQFAKKNGYTGTFTQYQNEDANRKASIAKAGVAQEKAEKAETYKTERTTRTINAIKDALPFVNSATAGLAGLTSFVPGTPAKTLEGKLNTIKANIGFNELQEMRAASPTGGALGQVAVQELNFLQGVLGSLDQKLSPAQLTSNLNAMLASLQRLDSAIKQGQSQKNSSTNDPLGLR